jgi:hypothetical protein
MKASAFAYANTVGVGDLHELPAAREPKAPSRERNT